MGHQGNINSYSFRVCDGVTYEKLEETYIILNTNDGEYYELNSTSSFIWDQVCLEQNIGKYNIRSKKSF